MASIDKNNNEYRHPDDPSTYLSPTDTLMSGGYDFAWCFVVYREVPGFSAYQVGTNGTVWSRARGGRRRSNPKWYQLRGCPNNKRYIRVHLSNRSRFIHNLVLETFIGACPSVMQCRHLDGNPKNNHLDNLRWGTPLENAVDAARHGTKLFGSRRPDAKLSEGDIDEIHRLAFDNVTNKAIAARFMVSPESISGILHGRKWTHVEIPTEIRICTSFNRRNGPLAFNAKLSEQDVIDIRNFVRQGESFNDIARRFGVSRSIVTGIANGKRRSYVLDEDGGNTAIAPVREQHLNAKLRPDQVAAIFELRSQGRSLLSIAQEFGVGKSTIGGIVRGQSWKRFGGSKS